MIAKKSAKKLTTVDLYRIPITTQVCLYTCLAKCKLWPKMMTCVPTNKPNSLAYLTTWFGSFRGKWARFLKSIQDLWTMNSKEVRALTKEI